MAKTNIRPVGNLVVSRFLPPGIIQIGDLGLEMLDHYANVYVRMARLIFYGVLCVAYAVFLPQ